MPAHLKGVETMVSEFLLAVKRNAPRWVNIRTIYPELSGEAGANYASRKKASPFSTRNIHQDERGEQKVWSSLVISARGYPEILIQGIKASDLPYLEVLVFDNLRAATAPPRANIAVSVPAGFNTFKRLLRGYGNTRMLNLDNEPGIPKDTDVLIWVQPSHITEKHIHELKRYLASGRPAILAGSPYAVAYESRDGGGIGYRTVRYGTDWEAILRPFGLTPQADLLMDTSNSPIYWAGPEGTAIKVEAPFQIRCMPGFYNLKGFAAPARGALSFVAAGPIQIDVKRAEQAGYDARVLGTTTDGAYVHALPGRTFTNTDLAPKLRTGKQNLLVLLEPLDTWGGQLLVFSSPSPFRDGIIDQPGHAHRVLLRTLARTFTSTERLVRGRISRNHPDPLPGLSANQRLSWRLVVVVLPPFALLLLAGIRYISTNPSNDFSYRKFPVQALIALAVALAGCLLWRGASTTFLDLTRDGTNSVQPETHKFLPKSRNRISLQLVITPQHSLPAVMKQVESTISSRIGELGLPLRILRPNTLSDLEVRELKGQGLMPFAMETVRNDSMVSLQVWSGLRIFWGQHVEVINRLDHRSVDHLEFLLATRIWKIENRQAPSVAVLGESPRLSPAEAYTDYYQKRLIPPKGYDVFSDAKDLLRRYGYEIVQIDPRDPKLPGHSDLLIWFQPRRDASQGISILSEHLAKGGKAIIALQHYNIQQRQYRGAGFHTVYWPQPQFQDMNQYLKMVGIEQKQEVLMDRTRSNLNLETQINRLAVREYENQEVALPFLIRAVGANFSRTDPVVSGLGDQLFIWGNRFSVDANTTVPGTMTVDTLISTSEVAWSYHWKGGWLPEDIFHPAQLLGRQPLAIRVSGTFPAVRRDTSGVLIRALQDSDPGAEMILIGCSEMFKNGVLFHPDYRHDQLLLNTVANSIYSPDLSRLQSRAQTVKGFVFQSTVSKRFWRIIVVSLGPLLLLIYGLLRIRSRYRASTLT